MTKPSPREIPSKPILPDDSVDAEADEQFLDDEDDVVARPEDADDAEEGEVAHRTFVIRRELAVRLDRYLRGRLKAISRSKVQQLIEAGGVTVNAKRPKASTVIKQGDVIDVILPPRAVKTIEPEDIPLDVLFEDGHLIVINKQAGLIVHPARNHTSGTLVNALAHHFKMQLEAAGGEWTQWKTRGFRKADDAPGKHSSTSASRAANRAKEVKATGDETTTQPDGAVAGLSSVGAAEFRPGIIHRLDKNTTGVMVVAKSDQAHWQVARQFEDRSTLKAYLAVVHGNLPEAAGVIDEPIGKHPTMREAYAIRHDSLAKHAVTLYRVREQYKGYCLVELELKTGRTHQIRVHLSYLGYPIVGDIVYGGEAIGQRELDEPVIPAGGRKLMTFARDRQQGVALEEQARKRPDLIMASPALHAAFLRFRHPIRDEPMTFTAPLHSPMRELVAALRQRRIEAPVATQGTWADLRVLAP